MQKRNTRSNKQNISHGSQAAAIFWVVFAAVVICVFLLNAGTIKRNFDIFLTRINTPPGMEELPFMDDEEIIDTVTAIEDLPVVSFITEQSQQQETQSPESQGTVVTEENTVQQVTENTTSGQRPPPEQQQEQRPVETRERNIYFTQISNDGQILQSRVTRRIPVSSSPLQDALNTMLIGPSSDELNRGLINIIPQNTRILLTTVRGNTAYISFSEDFLFNTFGVEGYIAQLRQVVWTVTEFSNVSDVQILIEGRRVDYLGDGIWIGSPISRQSF